MKKAKRLYIYGKWLILAVIISLVYTAVTVMSLNAGEVFAAEKNKDITLSIVRDDGIQVLIRDNGTYCCNTGITFFLEGEGALFQYCLCPQETEAYSYDNLDNGVLRLSGQKYARKEKNWKIAFRAFRRDDPDRVIWESGPYRICFDVTAPQAELSIEKSTLVPDTVKTALSMSDEKSGISYAELRQNGEILYRQDFYAKDRPKMSESFRFIRRSSQIDGKLLKLYVMDRAGNERMVESRYFDEQDKPVGGSYKMFEYFHTLFYNIRIPDDNEILAGCIVISLIILGLVGELVSLLLKWIRLI